MNFSQKQPTQEQIFGVRIVQNRMVDDGKRFVRNIYEKS